MTYMIEFYNTRGERISTWHSYPCVPAPGMVVMLATGRPGSGDLFEYKVRKVYLYEMKNIHVEVEHGP
jgi:hypothetical protein